MSDNDLDLLIEIFVATDRDGNGRIGTGYPVAKDRILTAGHVLFPDGQDPGIPFEIRWHHRRGSASAAGRWQSVARSQILWPPPERRGDPHIPDATLIAHTFPAEVGHWRVLTARNHATGTPWESQGFANAGCRDDNTRVPVPMRGATYRKANRAVEAWVDVVAEVKVPADWKGASGCPVLVFSQVAGIITEVPPGFGGKMLTAVPASELLAYDDFYAALGYPPVDERRAALIDRLTATRNESPVAIGALEVCLYSRGQTALWRDPVEPVDMLADALMLFDVATVLRHAAKAIRQLKPNRRGDAHALSTLVQKILPLLYDHTTVEAVRRTTAESNAILVGFPVATRAVAEVVLAGVAGQAARFRAPKEGQELEGQLSLPQTPNCGIDPTGERKEEDYRMQMLRKLAVSELNLFESAFYRCACEFVPPAIRARAGGGERIHRMAARRLCSLAELQERRRYYLFELPQDPGERAECLTALRRLKHVFEDVDFLELICDPDLVEGEYGDFLPLDTILRVSED